MKIDICSVFDEKALYVNVSPMFSMKLGCVLMLSNRLIGVLAPLCINDVVICVVSITDVGAAMHR